jgi:hypothetical protein
MKKLLHLVGCLLPYRLQIGVTKVLHTKLRVMNNIKVNG